MAEQVSALLLAAGSARRMGRLKQLLPLGDRSVIRHCLDSIVSAGIGDIVAVVGPDGHDIVNEIFGFPLTIVFNPDRESEMAESVRIGVRAVDRNATGILVCLSDHPLVFPATIVSLVEQHSKAENSIVMPVFNGKKGHPTLFPSAVIYEIFSGLSLREIIRKNAGTTVSIEVPDEGILLDMDTPADYESILSLQKRWSQSCRKPQ